MYTGAAFLNFGAFAPGGAPLPWHQRAIGRCQPGAVPALPSSAPAFCFFLYED
jgi:hypothetical protein